MVTIFSRNLFIYFSDEYKIEAYRELQKISKNEYTQIVLGHADISSKLAKYIKKGEFYNE
ncbi:hypothetical protein [Sulfurimonas sp.]|uniref:hypothetical protein n=1 Tax=Sulfurimonas sp. TaxID=2022749 RepID=UPI00261A55F3|nr:hypothetical protein [Sulfurimonas sp.]